MLKTSFALPRIALALLLGILWTGTASAFSLAIGNMQPGDSVTVTFDTTIVGTLTSSTIQIVAQGTIAATSVSTVVTDDPETTSSATDSTKTPLYNNPPVLDLDSGNAGNDVAAAFTEQTPVLVSPAGTIWDPEGNPIKTLKATLTSRPNGNSVESLSLNSTATAAASGASLTVSYTTTTGVLLISSVSGSSTNVFQTVLRGILYNNTSDSPVSTSRTVTVVPNDGNDGIARTATITVATVADTPSVTSATTSEDTQTSSGLVLSRNAGDGTEVTHFKITGVTGGILFQNDGTTPINEGDFITFAEGNAGLKLTPAGNLFTPGTSFGFNVQASLSAGDAGLGGSAASATVTVNPVADTPSVTDSTTLEDTQTSSGLVIGRNVADGTEVTYFKITGISNGTLFQNDGTTLIDNGDFITFVQGNAGLRFTPSANLNSLGTIFGFTVQASVSAGDAGLGGSAVSATITVDPSADTPSATGSTTSEDTQTTSGLVISRNAADGVEVTHFKITGMTGGTLFQNDGTTAISSGEFVTFAQGDAGLKFTPTPNLYSPGTTFGFSFQASLSSSDAGLSGGAATASVTVSAVADTPSVTSATTAEDMQTTSGLVISRNAADSTEVTHFKITGISNGTLFQNDGTTAINDGDFITFAEGNAGLRFTPGANLNSPATTFEFVAQASTSAVDAGRGGGTATASVTVTAVNDDPVVVDDTILRGPNDDVKVKIATLLANDTDAENDPRSFIGIISPSAGGASVTASGDWIYYIHNGTAADTFSYTISDGQGGTATGTVQVNIQGSDSQSSTRIDVVVDGTNAHLTFDGIPGRSYVIQFRDNINDPWQDQGTASLSLFGVFEYDDPAGSPARFYRYVYR